MRKRNLIKKDEPPPILLFDTMNVWERDSYIKDGITRTIEQITDHYDQCMLGKTRDLEATLRNLESSEYAYMFMIYRSEYEHVISYFQGYLLNAFNGKLGSVFFETDKKNGNSRIGYYLYVLAK